MIAALINDYGLIVVLTSLLTPSSVAVEGITSNVESPDKCLKPSFYGDILNIHYHKLTVNFY